MTTGGAQKRKNQETDRRPEGRAGADAVGKGSGNGGERIGRSGAGKPIGRLCPHPGAKYHTTRHRPVFWLAFILICHLPGGRTPSGVEQICQAYSSGGCAGMFGESMLTEVTGLPVSPCPQKRARHL